jgi:RNA polymerase sigma-70 factor (ECF subfamily)
MSIGKDEWERCYRELLPKVFSYFRYRIDDGQAAEELTSRTFEKAWRSHRRYRRNKAAFATWIFTIARNTGNDYFRRKDRPLETDLCEADGVSASTEEVYERQEQALRLRQLLSTLEGRQRELIALKYGAELTNRKIAEVTGLSETNVGTILYRSVRALREQWEAEEDE